MVKKVIANCVFALLYVASVFFFFKAENLHQECIVFLMSHLFLLGALTFRRKNVAKAEICRTFVLCIMLITALTWLPISFLWTLVPFWIIGYVHATKVSYDDTIGYYDKTELSEKEKFKRIMYIWLCICLLVTFFIVFS